MSYNLNIVRPQEQFDLACALARNNEHARIAMLMEDEDWTALEMKLAEGDVYNVQTRQVTLLNGSTIKWASPNPADKANFNAWMITTLFVAERVNYEVVQSVRLRFRSNKFKGDFKTYFHHGHVMWEVWEQYGGS